MLHKATVSLIPQFMSVDDLGEEFIDYHRIRSRTIAYSVDDAIGIAKNGNSESAIEIWNRDFHDSDELARLRESGVNLRWMYSGVSNGEISLDIVDQLTTHKSKRYARRNFSDIHTLTIHHTAVDWNPDLDGVQNVDRLASYHVNHHGWPGIAYHYVIAPDGMVYKSQYMTALSYHTGTANPVALGICLFGNFVKRKPDVPQLWAAKNLIKRLRMLSNRYLAVIPHKRMPNAQTACPGEYELEDWLTQITYGDLK